MTSSRLRWLVSGLLVAPGLAVLQTASLAAETKDDKVPDAAVVTSSDRSGDKDKDTLQLDTMAVTGSRIRTLNGEVTAAPVFTVSQLELQERGVSRLADIRWAIPQLAGSVGFNDNLMNSGPSRASQVSTSLNLRGLGGNSTLVLIDGHRVPHTGQAAPGGAGGREDFNIDGIPLSAVERVEVLPQGAGAIYGAEAIGGVINIVLKKNYQGVEAQFTYDNTFDSDVAQITGTLTAGFRTGKVSTFLTLSQIEQHGLASRDRWFTAKSTSVQFNPYAGPGTLSTGYYPDSATANLPGLTRTFVGIPAGTKGNFTVADAAAAPIGAHFDSADYSNQIDPSTTRSLVFKADYAQSVAFDPYVEIRWSDFKNEYLGAPTTLTTQMPAGYPGNPFAGAVYVSKVFYDLPRPSISSAQVNSGVVAGARGALPHEWRYDAFYSWARNVVKDVSRNNGIDFGKLSAAMASATPPVLAYDSSAVSDPSNSLANILANSRHEDTTDVSEYSVQADGPVWTEWAGDVKAAVGGEAQEEKARFFQSPAISYLLSAPFSRRVNAAYGELSVPLLSDNQHLPLVHKLEVGGAIRHEDFSDIGSDLTHAYHALYQPTTWLTFRASRTEGFKAPTLYSLWAPNYTTTTSITASRKIVDTLRNNEPVVGTFVLTTGGQPHLKPERSISRNAGIVLDVPGVKGLSASVDFWDLNYTDKVGSPGYQDLIIYFPERVTRGPSTGGLPGPITAFDNSTINQASVKTKGVDYRLSYNRHTGFGDFLVSAALSDESPQVSRATPSSALSVWKQPKRATGSAFWMMGPWGGGVSVNYQSSFPSYSTDPTPYSSYIEWNPQVSYDFGATHVGHSQSAPWWSRVFADSKLSVTVVNVFNKEPTQADVINGTYAMDPRLRRYIVTVTKKF